MATDTPEIDRPENIAERLGWPAPDAFVDALGLLCPHPLLATRQAADELQAGDCLMIAATDPHAALDLEVYARKSGHRLRSSRENDICYFMLEITSG